MCKLGDYILKKNTILVWNRLRIIASMLRSRGVPNLQSFSNAKKAFVDDTIELSKSMRWSNDHACFTMFDH